MQSIEFPFLVPSKRESNPQFFGTIWERPRQQCPDGFPELIDLIFLLERTEPEYQLFGNIEQWIESHWTFRPSKPSVYSPDFSIATGFLQREFRKPNPDYHFLRMKTGVDLKTASMSD